MRDMRQVLNKIDDDTTPARGWFMLMGIVAVFAILVMVLGVAFTVVCLPALANDNGQWGNQPAKVRQWFQSLMQPDNPMISCCGEADAFEADTFESDGQNYVAVITDGKGVWPNGTRISVPTGKMKWDQGNPTGHGIIFLKQGTFQVYCYVTPSGI